MKGLLIRFYMREDLHHQGRPAWEWLLQQANAIGVRGGSVFKAVACFGKHHRVHEAKFFELAGALGVEVQFVVTDSEATSLRSLLEREGVHVLYAQTAAEFGFTGIVGTEPKVD